MIERVKRGAVLAVAMGCFGAALGAPLTPPAEIKDLVAEMRESGADVRAGYSRELGVYVVGIGTAEIKGSKDVAREKAKVNAVDAIAAYLGAAIESSTKMATEESTVGDVTETKEFYQKVQSVDVKQFLKGIVTLDSRTKGDGDMEVAIYCTSTTKDASAELVAAKTQDGTVQATGVAETREMALHRAQRSAVEQVVGTSSVSKTVVHTLDSQESIKSRKGTFADGLIEEYRILPEEDRCEEGFRVTIVAKVSKKKVLDTYRAYMKAMDKPAFYLQSSDEELEDAFTQYFIDKGFIISRRPEGANFSISLKGDFAPVEDPVSGRAGTQLSMTVTVMTIDGAKVLLKVTNDPRKASFFTGSKDRQKEKTAEKACKQIESNLGKAIHKMVVKMVDEIDQ